MRKPVMREEKYKKIIDKFLRNNWTQKRKKML